MRILETDRLILRTLNIDDIDCVMNFWGDIEVMKYCGGAGTRERELKALQFYINLQKEKGFSPYIVAIKESGKVIGVCGFNPPNDGYDAEIMYHLAKDYWGRGYATEAAQACIDYARRHTKISRLGASIDPENGASRNVLEKLGFKCIGMKWCEVTNQEEPYFELILTHE